MTVADGDIEATHHQVLSRDRQIELDSNIRMQGSEPSQLGREPACPERRERGDMEARVIGIDGPYEALAQCRERIDGLACHNRESATWAIARASHRRVGGNATKLVQFAAGH